MRTRILYFVFVWFDYKHLVFINSVSVSPSFTTAFHSPTPYIRPPPRIFNDGDEKKRSFGYPCLKKKNTDTQYFSTTNPYDSAECSLINALSGL